MKQKCIITLFKKNVKMNIKVLFKKNVCLVVEIGNYSIDNYTC